MHPYDDDGVDIPLSVSKPDAFLLLVDLLQDKDNARLVITPNDFTLEISPTHTKLFAQLIRGLYPDLEPGQIKDFYVGGRADIHIAELRDLDVINKIGRHVPNVVVAHMSPTEGRQRVPDLGLDPKMEQHITRLLVEQKRAQHER